MLVRINQNIPDGGSAHHKPGDVKHTSKMPGCDIGWLIESGAITPVGDPKAPLIGEDPSKDELLAEVVRMQGRITDLEDELTTARRELEEAKKGPPRGRDLLDSILLPDPDGANRELTDRSAALESELAQLRATNKRLQAERDSAWERSDKYAAALSERESRPPEPATPTTAAGTPENPNPTPIRIARHK